MTIFSNYERYRVAEPSIYVQNPGYWCIPPSLRLDASSSLLRFGVCPGFCNVPGWLKWWKSDQTSNLILTSSSGWKSYHPFLKQLCLLWNELDELVVSLRLYPSLQAQYMLSDQPGIALCPLTTVSTQARHMLTADDSLLQVLGWVMDVSNEYFTSGFA